MRDETHQQKHRRKHRYARALRKRMTLAEEVLWNGLRNRQLSGCKFRRQVPFGDFIVDFLCYEHRLVIEVDGAVHDQQKDYDHWREGYFLRRGYRLLRFRNDEVQASVIKVLERIKEQLHKHPPSPGLPAVASGHCTHSAHLRQGYGGQPSSQYESDV